jgi:uncharacterized GH25 family protein
MSMRFLFRSFGTLALSSAMVLSFTTAHAHEFWIDPVTFTPALAATVPITLRIGSDFRGNTYPYVRSLDRGFKLVTARGTIPVKSIDGDDPASEVTFRTPGLAILWHRRAPEPVTFDTMKAFEETLVDEGLEAIAAAHKASGRSQTKIKELFARCAKALLQVGVSREGNDRAVGLPLELVAEANPYTHPKDDPLPVQVLLNGKPLPNALVKVFNSADATAAQRLRSDAAGRVVIAASRKGDYLVSAVHMETAKPADKADYVSLWASLTFARP